MVRPDTSRIDNLIRYYSVIRGDYTRWYYGVKYLW